MRSVVVFRHLDVFCVLCCLGHLGLLWAGEPHVTPLLRFRRLLGSPCRVTAEMTTSSLIRRRSPAREWDADFLEDGRLRCLVVHWLHGGNREFAKTGRQLVVGRRRGVLWITLRCHLHFVQLTNGDDQTEMTETRNGDDRDDKTNEDDKVPFDEDVLVRRCALVELSNATEDVKASTRSSWQEKAHAQLLICSASCDWQLHLVSSRAVPVRHAGRLLGRRRRRQLVAGHLDKSFK